MQPTRANTPSTRTREAVASEWALSALAVHVNGAALLTRPDRLVTLENPWPARWRTVEAFLERLVGCVILLLALDAAF